MPLIHDAALAAGAFAADDFNRPEPEAKLEAGALVGLDRLSETGAARPVGVEIDNDADLSALVQAFDRLALIAVRFPSFADGRGFSIAQRLRSLGYAGRLRAVGHVIVDQYPFARAVGFDEVEISEADARRQPIAYWRGAAASRRSYQRKIAVRAEA